MTNRDLFMSYLLSDANIQAWITRWKYVGACRFHFWYLPHFKLRPSSSMNGSVRLSVLQSVRPSYRFDIFVLLYHHEIFRKYYQWQMWCSWKRSRSQVNGPDHKRSKPNLSVSGSQLQVESICGNEMMHKACGCVGDVPYLVFFKVIRQISS